MSKFYDCVTYYTIENWEILVKRAKITPISTQLARKFKIAESEASKIARYVAAMKHCGII